MQSEAERIAAGLTKAQRDILARGQFPAWMRERREHRVKNALVKRGLARFHHVIAGCGDFELTDTGLEVRAILQQRFPVPEQRGMVE